MDHRRNSIAARAGIDKVGPGWIVVVGALLSQAGCSDEPGALAALGGEGEPPPEVRIVLITLDTLRHDSFFGSGDVPGEMPLTRAWAEDARVFERYYSCSSATQPAHATLFTGLHPWQSGVSHNGALLGEEHEVLAERLREAGFRTGAVVASYPVHSTFGYDQGFDVFLEQFNRGQDWNSWVGREVVADGGFFASGDLVVDEALRLLDGLGGRKQFVWIHLFDAHWPYGDRSDASREETDRPVVLELAAAPERRDEILARARELYGYDVNALDRDLARIFERLDRDPGETHVIVVSDHGESLGEGNAMGHGMRLTEEQLLVPLIVRSPRVEPGVRVDPVGTLDVTALLLSLAGVRGAPAGSLDLAGAELPSERAVVGMRSTFTNATEIRADGTKHPLDPLDNRYFSVEGGVLYTGNRDLLQIGDVGPALDDPDLTARLASRFDGYEAERRSVESRITTDERGLQALEALGYTGNE